MLKKSWQPAIENALSNSSRRPMCANETTVQVTVVPILAPIIIGTALANGRGFSGAATSPTIIDVDTDELCTSVVASTPTKIPTKGFAVRLKKLSRKSVPNSLNPSPSPLTPSKNTNSKNKTDRTRRMTEVSSCFSDDVCLVIQLYELSEGRKSTNVPFKIVGSESLGRPYTAGKNDPQKTVGILGQAHRIVKTKTTRYRQKS